MRYLIAALLLAIGTNAHADDSWKAKCADISKTARVVMEARQASVPMDKIMDAVGGNPGMETMIIQAYEQPRYGSAEYKARAAADFAETWYMTCVRVLRNKN